MRVCFAGAAMLLASAAASAQVVFAVNTEDQLISFNASTPGTLLSGHGISGMLPNDHIMSIDFRPSNGRLYGVGLLNQLYQIDTATGQATAIGSPFSPLINGTDFSIDFNPVTGKLAFVTELGQNLTLDPDTGQVVTVGPNISSALLHGLAYSNNFVGAPSTTLFGMGVNPAQGTIYRLFQVDPVAGTTTQLTMTGIPNGQNGGMDIVGDSIAYFFAASLTNGVSQLASVNLQTGTNATLLGGIGGPAAFVRDIAVPAPGVSAVGFLAVFAAGRRRRSPQAAPHHG